ncbi:hypothetical protein EDB87DRAFT_1824587 [Lactarius vividus]|nr:hypothetical protein EDB87DRAFT_1824587 [Lactarius vividus]
MYALNRICRFVHAEVLLGDGTYPKERISQTTTYLPPTKRRVLGEQLFALHGAIKHAAVLMRNIIWYKYRHRTSKLEVSVLCTRSKALTNPHPFGSPADVLAQLRLDISKENRLTRRTPSVSKVAFRPNAWQPQKEGEGIHERYGILKSKHRRLRVKCWMCNVRIDLLSQASTIPDQYPVRNQGAPMRDCSKVALFAALGTHAKSQIYQLRTLGSSKNQSRDALSTEDNRPQCQFVVAVCDKNFGRWRTKSGNDPCSTSEVVMEQAGKVMFESTNKSYEVVETLPPRGQY